jgi:FkbM family methyltransferase
LKDSNNISIKTRVLDGVRFFFRVPVIEELLIWLKEKNKAFAKFVPNYYQYKPKTFRSFVRSGIRFRTDISDWLGYCAYFNVKNDPYDSLFGLVVKDMTILDVGSNIGFTALNMASLTGRNGMVYAFEPDGHNYTFLKCNIGLNKELPIESFQLGAGNINEKRKLIVHNSGNRGENKITTLSASDDFAVIEIIKLDDFIETKKILRVDLIKIDTEGFELNVLKGAENTFSIHSPILFIEVDDANLKEQNSSAKELIMYVVKLGYQIVSAQTNKSVSTDDDFTDCHFDVICNKHGNK